MKLSSRKADVDRRRRSAPRRQPTPTLFDVAPTYKGGRTAIVNGYVFEFLPEHPARNAWGFVRQHQLVAEDMIGRPMAKGEVVHHADENRSNNDPENLRVMHFRDHLRLHASRRIGLTQVQITESEVASALEGRSIKRAAEALGVCAQTLRNRFPDLIRPRQRTSPVLIDDPRDLERILEAARRDDVLLRDLAKELHISAMSILRICRRRGVTWVKKRRADIGGQRSTYRGKPTRQAP